MFYVAILRGNGKIETREFARIKIFIQLLCKVQMLRLWCVLSTPGTRLSSVLLPILFNRLFGWPFQAEYAIKSAVKKNYSGSEAVNGSFIIENRAKYL